MKQLAGSIGAFVQDLIEEKKTFHMTLQSFSEITKVVYGGAITLAERQNYTTYEYEVQENKAEVEEIEEAVDSGIIDSLKTILDDLCIKGFIEEGSYFIRNEW